MSERARILIVDDHPLVREGLCGRIDAQSDMSVCGEATDVEDALVLLSSLEPDLMIVDLALKTGHGLDLIRTARSRKSVVKILVISAYEEYLYAERSLRAGAQGYVNKQALQEKVIEAIRAVLAGRQYVSTEMAGRLVAQAIGNKVGSTSAIECLSDRELQVFQLIGHGNSTSDIAKQLDLSVHTIDTYREKIRAKLILRNGTELMQRAVQWVLENT